MLTYGKGRWAQIKWDLTHKPCCKHGPGCPEKGKNGTHALGCEQGILNRAKNRAGYDKSGKKKQL